MKNVVTPTAMATLSPTPMSLPTLGISVGAAEFVGVAVGCILVTEIC